MNNNSAAINPVNPTSITPPTRRDTPQLGVICTLVRLETCDRCTASPPGGISSPWLESPPGHHSQVLPRCLIPEPNGGPLDPDRDFGPLEGFNLGYERPPRAVWSNAQAPGAISRPVPRQVESTSGTLGLGLALAGGVPAIPVTLVTDPGWNSIIARDAGLAYGAGVVIWRRSRTPVGGWQQKARMTGLRS